MLLLFVLCVACNGMMDVLSCCSLGNCALEGPGTVSPPHCRGLIVTVVCIAQRATPCGNGGCDNTDSDLILHVHDVIVCARTAGVRMALSDA